MILYDHAHIHVASREGSGTGTDDSKIAYGPLRCSICGTLMECICIDYDGKGWSVCGQPCPLHQPPMPDTAKLWEDLNKVRGEHESGER
jgi:hypothetical protein